MVTTFVPSVGNHTKGLWPLAEKASQADISLAELEHPSHRKMMSQRLGRVPIYVHPCFYKSLKLRYPLDVSGVSRDGRVTNELGTGSLRHAVGILTPEDFPAVVESKVSGYDGSKTCHFECVGTERSKLVYAVA